MAPFPIQQRLQQLQSQSQLSHGEVAEQLGITVSQWLKVSGQTEDNNQGNRGITLQKNADFLRKCAGLFECSPDDLV